MATVRQPHPYNPTNKLTAAVVTSAFCEFSRVVVIHVAPTFYDPALWASLTPVLVFIVGWFTRDHPNLFANEEDPT